MGERMLTTVNINWNWEREGGHVKVCPVFSGANHVHIYDFNNSTSTLLCADYAIEKRSRLYEVQN